VNTQVIVDAIILGLLGVIAYFGKKYFERIERHMSFSHDINNNFAVIQLWMDRVSQKLGLPPMPPLKGIGSSPKKDDERG